jgi:hypothetical protein
MSSFEARAAREHLRMTIIAKRFARFRDDVKQKVP